MKVTYWSDRSNIADTGIAELIAYDVEAANSERGALEDLEAKVRVLTKILGVVASCLTPEQQQQVVSEGLFFHKLPGA